MSFVKCHLCMQIHICGFSSSKDSLPSWPQVRHRQDFWLPFVIRPILYIPIMFCIFSTILILTVDKKLYENLMVPRIDLHQILEITYFIKKKTEYMVYKCGRTNLHQDTYNLASLINSASFFWISHATVIHYAKAN